ncbi:MAG: ABC transporter substrate-binding protein [Xenococcaceae cyanobacterium]
MILSLVIVACNTNSKLDISKVAESPTESDVLTIWWDKGYLLEEDEAVRKIVSNWEKESGTKVRLSFQALNDAVQKAKKAIKAGHPPDIWLSTRAERELTPCLAWKGKLLDVSEVIEPVKHLYSPGVLQAVSYYNKAEQKRSYYAVPIGQATIYLHYWRDLLEQSGRSPRDIPQDWDGFWEFWKSVQDDLRSLQEPSIYSLGFTISPKASDTYYFFEQVLEAYDVKILDREGQLQVDEPQVRQGLVQVLEWYAKLYQQGYVPPEAVKWLNADNNFHMLNRTMVMTPNRSLSIPASQRQDQDIYINKLGTIEFPNKPSGESMRYLVSISQVVVFAESKNQKLAKEFLAYLVQPETLDKYIKDTQGRHFPVMKSAWDDPFWTNSADPHISIARKMLSERLTRSFYHSQNPAYSKVLEKNIWGRALNRIVVDSMSPEQAADEAIEGIKQIFSQWQ